MNLKHLTLAAAVAVISLSASAQKAAVQSAKADYEKFTGTRNAPAIAVPLKKSAMENIDKAVLNSKTATDPMAWAYRALIYADSYYYDQSNAAHLDEATKSIAKARELDKDNANKTVIDDAARFLWAYHVSKGETLYNNKEYANAYDFFQKGLEFRPKDSVATYLAGLASMQLKNLPRATEMFNDVIKTHPTYSNLAAVYSDLSLAYLWQKDTASAVKILTEGTAKFPQNEGLATRNIEVSLNTGKYKEVIGTIETQMAKDPKNKLYPYYLGVAYETTNDGIKAEDAYKKAIENDPEFANAYLNLGTLILNSGIKLYNKSAQMPVSKKAEADAVMKTAQAEFDRALPYLQKSTQLEPKSQLAWNNLRKYYQLKGQEAKAAEITEKMKSL